MCGCGKGGTGFRQGFPEEKMPHFGHEEWGLLGEQMDGKMEKEERTI